MKEEWEDFKLMTVTWGADYFECNLRLVVKGSTCI